MAALAAWSVLLLFVASTVLRPWPDSLYAVDFVAFWTGGDMVAQGAGQQLFDLEKQRVFQVEDRQQHATVDRIRDAPGSLPFINPPALALLFAPLTALPMPLAFLLWSTLSIVAVLAAVCLPLRGRVAARSTAAVMLTFPAVADTVLLGRVDGLLLAAFGLGLMAMSKGRPALGGALLGLLWLKPQYAVLLGMVLLVKGRWRELGGMVVSAGFIAALSVAVVGFDGMARYLEVLRQIGSFYPPPSAVVNPTIMVNWRPVLMLAWPGIPEATGSALLLLLEAATALGSLLAWRGRWDPSSPRFALQMLVTAMATILVAPHSHFHGTILLLAPLALWSGLRTKDSGLSGSLDRRGAPACAPSGGRTHRSAPARILTQSLVLSPQSWWTPLLVIGYLLELALWVLLDLRWLLVPYFLLAMALLIFQISRSEGRWQQ